jgi:threonine dehydratase
MGKAFVFSVKLALFRSGWVKFSVVPLKILVEPSGAAAAAAVLFHKLSTELRSVGVVLSGNIDFEDLAKY